MALQSPPVIGSIARRGATALNRRRQFLTELRLDEQALVAEALTQVDEYREHDRDTDIAFVQAIRSLYATLDNDEAMRKCERVYTVWKTTENGDDQIITRLDDQLDRTRVVMRANNDELLNGAWTPAAAGMGA
jgi:hypothetical protein